MWRHLNPWTRSPGTYSWQQYKLYVRKADYKFQKADNTNFCILKKQTLQLDVQCCLVQNQRSKSVQLDELSVVYKLCVLNLGVFYQGNGACETTKMQPTTSPWLEGKLENYMTITSATVWCQQNGTRASHSTLELDIRVRITSDTSMSVSPKPWHSWTD